MQNKGNIDAEPISDPHRGLYTRACGGSPERVVLVYINLVERSGKRGLAMTAMTEIAIFIDHDEEKRDVKSGKSL